MVDLPPPLGPTKAALSLWPILKLRLQKHKLIEKDT